MRQPGAAQVSTVPSGVGASSWRSIQSWSGPTGCPFFSCTTTLTRRLLRIAAAQLGAGRAFVHGRIVHVRGGWCSYPRFMPVSEWRPLSWRREGVPATAWRGEVPAPMARPLREWVYTTLRETHASTGIGEDRIVERLMLRLDLILPDAEAREGDTPDSGAAATSRFLAYDTSTDLLPDVADAILDLLSALDGLVRKPWHPHARGQACSRMPRIG